MHQHEKVFKYTKEIAIYLALVNIHFKDGTVSENERECEDVLLVERKMVLSNTFDSPTGEHESLILCTIADIISR